MQVAELNKKKKRRRNRNGQGQRRTDNDPLHSFEGVNLEGIVDDIDNDNDAGASSFEDPIQDSIGEEDQAKKKQKVENRVVANTKDGTGASTSGRNAWKQKHGKGKFSRRYKPKPEGQYL